MDIHHESTGTVNLKLTGDEIKELEGPYVAQAAFVYA